MKIENKIMYNDEVGVIDILQDYRIWGTQESCVSDNILLEGNIYF